MHSENKLLHNWLIKRILNNNVSRILPEITGVVYDLGCGTRPYEADILKYADGYVGVDWSNSLHGSKCDIVADLNKELPVDKNSADTLISFEVMEHLCEPQIMLEQAYKLLKPGGRFYLSVPFQWHVHEAPWDYYRYTRFGLEYMFKKAGFVVEDIRPTTGFWVAWFLKLNYQLTRLIRGPVIVKVVIRGLLIPVWFLNQSIAIVLDRVWGKSESETAGYFVTACKDGNKK